ncbi:MAG TPA: Ku protein [Firmicutes bacterium]|uniref:Non-homologous end joining protein Ku n=1 Tax=Candidatus Fermentithermobacillus carboniphilus TaxID=3085328 RepID=A0AAT9LCN9_9FIRM|nr:MAG: Ku protein [Candidatus Fermentithermobacillus carboniphilus]HHW17965.1 Ku protein [Candidatus Fermentithermobacillaceae bacterium]
MRPLWNGTLAFGLVVIPIRLYAATERKNPSFHLLHERCHSPVRYMKWCPVCETEVGLDEVVRAYEYEKGRYVMLSDEDLEAVPGPEAHKVEILDFVDLSDVDPVYFEKSFFLEPREGAEKAYRLLFSAMKEESKVAVAKVAIRAKETLALVRSYRDKFIMLETMYWADEVRLGDELAVPGDIEIDEREKMLATRLIEALSTEFRPEKYKSRQKEALFELIQKKIQGQQVVAEPERAPVQVIDLMEALRKSVEEARAKKSGRLTASKPPRRKRASGENLQDASPPPVK